jgi:hypothetical protein
MIGDNRLGPVAEAQRESSASLFILVQVQAGPPAFAGFASFGSASPIVAKAAP